jgi:ParB family chromosome partitioning protein
MTASHLTVVDDGPGTSTEPDASTEGIRNELDCTEPNFSADATDQVVVPPCPRVPLALLAPHPDNKREDLDLNDEFVASIREDGIRDPIEIVPLIGDPAVSAGADGPRPLFTIIDGHRRYFGGQLAGAADAPVYLAADRDGDLAGQYLDMFTTSRHSTRLKPIEEVNALFAAHQAGASQATIRRKTGLGRDEVKTAIKAGRLGKDARLKAGDGYDLTIDQYALLTEFEDDDAAIEEILRDIRTDGSGQHSAERIRQRRAEKAEAGKARERYAADGFEVAGALPDGARYLTSLRHDGEELTPEAHASCPGRGVVVRDWDPGGQFYCSSLDAHGHIYRFATPAADNPGASGGDPEPEPQGPGRQLVREGNRAWIAAGKVRGSFLKSLCGRATVSRDAQLFAARQILTMPATVAAKLSGARHEPLFRELTGGITAERLDGCKPGRLPLIQLALVLTSYEALLTSDGGKACWRPAAERRLPPVTREDAGAYLALLAGLGYQLSTIEQAMADGIPYTGEPGLDDPAEPATVG